MKQLSNESLAIILEVLSFFFVTTDLYGAKRLERLKDKLTKYDANSKEFKKLQNIIMAIAALGALYYFGKDGIFGDMVLNLINAIYTEYLKGNYFNMIFNFVIGGVVLITALIVFSIVFMHFGATASLPYIIIINVLIWILKQLLKILTFEGLLLLIGSIFFLISKYLSLKSLK